MPSFSALLTEVRDCTICAPHLPHGVRPVVQIHPRARVLIAGQAPGRRVHESGVPFDDPSGDRLRDWMGVTRDVFYDPTQIAILPMGFCFPGSGKSGDLPPRPECAPAWREELPETASQRGTHVAGWTVCAGVPSGREAGVADRDREGLARLLASRDAAAAPQPEKQHLNEPKPMVRG